VKSFKVVPKVKDDVIKFVLHFSSLVDQLRNILHPFAEASFPSDLSDNRSSAFAITVKPKLKVGTAANCNTTDLR